MAHVTSAPRGQRRILVVDDDPAVLKAIGVMLDLRGHAVLTAATAKQAIDLAASHTDQVDVLLTDLIMPGMSGLELIGRFGAEHPEIRCILMSGYPPADVPPETEFLSKPFDPAQLFAKVESAE